MSGLKYSFLLLMLIVSGCSRAGDESYTSGDIGGINHTSAVINYVKVNGYGGPNISPFGDGGGYCCVQLPEKWKPGLKAHIEWEVDPHTAPLPPGYQDWEKYQAWEKILKSSFQTHSTTVDIPQYGKERCGLTVHFLPCNQVKVTTVCSGYGTPNYPIKEPLNMKEPASCPVK
ncbi:MULTISPECIES: DUF3304 domain-containing protein [Enterobacter]|uniref:DUF3304 domain-containing protein n=1 Tax=Enterobacter TaxID=547 RepID=UPI001CBC421F|nr:MULTISPECIES: DUF3304 domain-containing protein [Enterobacter]UAN18656.1 DUF3304 domain-containing protein [Enterobacter asburiae]UAN24839.1 DUF3304 domain-containing protein [Enterobacter sp. JBIWA003]